MKENANWMGHKSVTGHHAHIHIYLNTSGTFTKPISMLFCIWEEIHTNTERTCPNSNLFLKLNKAHWSYKVATLSPTPQIYQMHHLANREKKPANGYVLLSHLNIQFPF